MELARVAWTGERRGLRRDSILENCSLDGQMDRMWGEKPLKWGATLFVSGSPAGPGRSGNLLGTVSSFLAFLLLLASVWLVLPGLISQINLVIYS